MWDSANFEVEEFVNEVVRNAPNNDTRPGKAVRVPV